MKMLQLWLIAGLLLPSLTSAATVKKRKIRSVRPLKPAMVAPAPAPPEAAVRVSAGPPKRSRTHSSNLTFNINTWHESIDLKQNGETTKMLSQIKTLVFGYDFNLLRPGSRWHYWFGLDVGVGALKGKGSGPIVDQFNDQPLILVAARLGMVFRSSPAARVGIFIPLTYRQIQWSYDTGSTVKADDHDLSAGVGLVYQLRLTKRTALQATLVRQHMWNANLWGVGVNFELF